MIEAMGSIFFAVARAHAAFIVALQMVAGTVSWLVFSLIFRIEVRGREHLRQVNLPLIVIANHKSVLDPQLVWIALMGRPALWPLRYMTKDPFFFVPGFNLLVWLLGAFRAYRGTGLAHSLRISTILLQKSLGTLIMFPEGKIIPLRGRLGQGRPGTAVLGITTGAALLPIGLITPPGLTFGHVLAKRVTIIMNIGEPFNLAAFANTEKPTVSRATQYLMERLRETYRPPN